MWTAPRALHNRIFIALMVALVALAWIALWIWSISPYAPFLDHEELGRFVATAVGGRFVREYVLLLLLFVAGWTLMILAMMLPISLPLIVLFQRLMRQRHDRLRLVTLLIAGYLSVWMLFGVLAYLNDLFIHEMVERSTWLDANSWLISAGTIGLAGVYQFTPLKNRCLDRCRSPLSFITEHWRGRREASHVFRLGVHHGLFCLGCCWSLMLIMFAVGAGNLGWMLALGTIMALEKNVSWGRRLSAPLGVILLGWGAAVALGFVPILQ